MTTLTMTCRVCKGTGSANNPPIFHNEGGEAPEPNINCEFCNGEGTVKINEPVGVRAARLVAFKIVREYPKNDIEHIYGQIFTNITNATNHYEHKIHFSITDGDSLFLEDPLPEDRLIENIIDKGNFIAEAKNILGLK